MRFKIDTSTPPAQQFAVPCIGFDFSIDRKILTSEQTQKIVKEINQSLPRNFVQRIELHDRRHIPGAASELYLYY